MKPTKINKQMRLSFNAKTTEEKIIYEESAINIADDLVAVLVEAREFINSIAMGKTRNVDTDAARAKRLVSAADKALEAAA